MSLKLPEFALSETGAKYPIRKQDDGSYRMYGEGVNVPVVGMNHAWRQANSWERTGVMPSKEFGDV